MSMNVRIQENVAVMEFDGKVIASTVQEVKGALDGLLEKGDRHFVFDFRQVDFIDSAGLGMLVASLRTVSRVEGDIKVAGLSPEVKSLFQLTRLHKVFDMFENADTAVQYYLSGHGR